MNYYKYTLALSDAGQADELVAFLSDAAFDTFEETPDGLCAYVPATADIAAAESALAELQRRYAFTWTKDFVPGQNWNELWESNFQPVVVGDFCAVRADFHDQIAGVRHELVINPKMAFGTGHHETTYMCLAALERLPLAGARLLDYGTGTGILAILAARLGAAEVEAVDIEEEAYRNTVENAALNGVSAQIVARCGTLDAIEGRDFDGVLANINRNVILASLDRLAALTRPGGWLLVSGILEEDGTVVRDAAEVAGFEVRERQQRGKWLCIEFIRI
jgi:ribosomal protein L11 methyltransferase